MNRNVGRMLVVGFTFLILAPAGFSTAWAAEARIEGFMFECRAPDGKKLKPKFGDVDGTFFMGLIYEPRHGALQRSLGTLLRETGPFIAPSQPLRLPSTLPRQRTEGTILTPNVLV